MSEINRPLRFGIIGCGALGVVHARRLTGLPNVEVIAVSDPDAAAMERVAEAIPGSGTVGRFSDYRELLNVGDLDAVCINSPNRWHVEQLLASLDRKLHVLCEKPLSMIPAEVEQVVEATERAGTTVAIAYQSRYRRDSRILRRALQSGQWGKITSIDVLALENWVTPNAGTWRHDPERCPGGFFADANGHQLDLVFWLTGLEGASVTATIEQRGTPVPIVTWGEARLREQKAAGGTAVAPVGASAPENLNSRTPNTEIPPSGIPFTFTFVGDARRWREEISIQTEKADFLMRDTRLLWSDGSREFAAYPDTESDAPTGELIDTPDAVFIAALRGGPPVASPPHTVWPVLRFTLAALKSAASGEPAAC